MYSLFTTLVLPETLRPPCKKCMSNKNLNTKIFTKVFLLFNWDCENAALFIFHLHNVTSVALFIT